MMKIMIFFRKLGLFLTVASWIGTLIISFFLGMAFNWATTTEVESTKDYNEIFIKKNECADYMVFIDIPKEYEVLEKIEEPIRKTISLYMQANNLKLSEGVHRFRIQNGSLDDYLNEDFKFEVIK